MLVPKKIFENRVPSNWNITPIEDGKIMAENTISGEFFNGTISEFNKKLNAKPNSKDSS